MSSNSIPKPWGYRWRSSRFLIVSSITIALFSETFLYGFLVPILRYMLEDRLHTDPLETQNYTTALLTIHGLFTLVSAPVIAHFVDKSPNRRTPLLIALAGCCVGTLLIATTASVWMLFVGRIIQAIAGAAAWVIGFALLVDNVAREHVGNMIGIAMSFVTAGIVGGPMVSGVLLEWIGYWGAWSVPLGVLVLDIIARLVLIDPADIPKVCPDPPTSRQPEPGESTGLLSGVVTPASHADATATATATATANATAEGFYRTILGDLRVLAGLANALMTSFIMAGFNTTLPVHLRDIFGWGSLPIGMMFFFLQLPPIILGGTMGWVRDKVGLKLPTTLGWIGSVPLLWLLGICGDERFPWANTGLRGARLFVGCILAFGVVSMLVRGAGPVQLARKSIILVPLGIRLVKSD
ncbi:hypothetical protein AOCH_002451 [Aspergillus ochraceoroseus]|uniref:Major facilitator superfamily (MFS) profile domain-containing protein n=1 Tax=Aspergillus ochraceoroseus TaxID=138278 RepID=A0A0F8UCM8_9EURO|nr:hypothetical protein AOCH_002451 [Aspergillus ochraceoroseus]